MLSILGICFVSKLEKKESLLCLEVGEKRKLASKNGRKN